MPKRKKKNKNKRTQELDSDNQSNDTDSIETQLSKREKRRQKKTQKQEQDQSIDHEDENNDQQEQVNNCEEEEEKFDLTSIKEQRQQELLAFGNNLMDNLHWKYFPFFTKDFEDIWKQQMIQIALFYDQKHICNNFDLLQSETLFNEKKNELELIWNQEIVALLKEDFEITEQQNEITIRNNPIKSKNHRKRLKSNQQKQIKSQSKIIQSNQQKQIKSQTNPTQTEENINKIENNNNNNWDCKKCTFSNSNDNLICEMCETGINPNSVDEKEEIEQKYAESSDSDSDENTVECPICLADDYTILCELDCYRYRNDNVKHCICLQCVHKLFSSNRFYQRAKCPFCRHTIHKNVILNNNNLNNAEIENDVEQMQGGYNRQELLQRYRQHLADRQNQVNAGDIEWDIRRIKIPLFLIALFCLYYGYYLIGFICLGISLCLFGLNHDEELVNNLGEEMRIVYDNLGAEMRMVYDEWNAQQRVERSLQHVRNRNHRVVRNRNRDSNVSRVNRTNNRHRNKGKNKRFKVGRQTQKYNKRFRNRSHR